MIECILFLFSTLWSLWHSDRVYSYRQGMLWAHGVCLTLKWLTALRVRQDGVTWFNYPKISFIHRHTTHTVDEQMHISRGANTITAKISQPVKQVQQHTHTHTHTHTHSFTHSFSLPPPSFSLSPSPSLSLSLSPRLLSPPLSLSFSLSLSLSLMLYFIFLKHNHSLLLLSFKTNTNTSLHHTYLRQTVTCSNQ